MQHFWRNVLRGLMAVIPILATLYLLVWLVASVEWVLGQTVMLVVPDEHYWPGMGLMLGIGLLYALGWIVDHWLLKRTVELTEALLTRVPVASKILAAVKDLMVYFNGERRRAFDRVVAVDFDQGEVSVLGLVTRDDLSGLPGGLRYTDRVAVYIPGSYQIGGFTLLIPRSRLHTVDMSVEDALRFAVTGAMSLTDNTRQLPE
ncbi:MAG: DUF502 domain-containing protein [Aquisalimonadaceae bacterium]